MRERVRRQMVLLLGWLVLAIVLAVVLGYAGRAAFRAGAPAWLRVAPMIAVVLVAALGIYSTGKNLRCPSCERGVASLVTKNYSISSGAAGRTCPGCNARLFPDDMPRRLRPIFVMVFGVGVALGVLRLVLLKH